MRWRHRALGFALILTASLVATILSNILLPSKTLATAAFLVPAPTQTVGHYDYFGKLLTPQQAAQLVRRRGLDVSDPVSYQRIGAVEINLDLLEKGENIFFSRKIGDTFGFQGVFGFGAGLATLKDEVETAIAALDGEPTTNLSITLQKDINLGSRTFPKGLGFNTGFDVERGGSFPGLKPNGDINVDRSGTFPLGLNRNGDITCALCHVTLNKTGSLLKGVPNTDLAIPFFIALAPNSAAGFARLDFNPLDPKYQGNGKQIIDSAGQLVTLPDPQKFEAAFDDAVLDVALGHFESSPDGINNTTKIPNLFTFKSGPYTSGGEFAVGPFAGLSAQAASVFSSEVNLLAAAQLSAQIGGIDPEVYLGTILQNAAETRIRLPEGQTVKPSEWLRQLAPDPMQAELEDQNPAPDTGVYPHLQPTLFTYNGLVFGPNILKTPDAPAHKPFLFAENALAVFQNSLVPPANKSPENQQALLSGSVERGAKVFDRANCASCHIPPFFTDNKIHPTSVVKSNPARAQSRLALNELLVPPQVYTFNTPIPVPANAESLKVPTEGISPTPTTLPFGLLPDGGYKTPSLRGVYLSAPYLHDGGVAMRAGSLEVASDGSFTVVDPSGVGLTGTLSQGIPADSASSLRALFDRKLRQQVVATNKANPALVRNNLDGSGHDFFVDKTTGFSPTKQTDLINFLLALDDDPGSF